MADSTITDLPAAAALAGTEPVPLDQAGATVRATVQAIANLALGGVAAGYQPLDADLTAIAALAPANNNIMQRKAGGWTASSPATVKTDLALTKSDVGLANVDNTTDTSKPVSGPQVAAIAVVQSDVDAHEGRTDNPHTVTKAQVGLGSVDNTADSAKPVSTAQQTALNLKANLAGPTFTGVPAAPTASPGTSTTQIATTAFVAAAVTGGSVADGDKGDITVSGSGATWTVNSGAVAVAEVSGLTAALDGKAATVHTHVTADVTGLDAALTAKAPLDDPTLTGGLWLNSVFSTASLAADVNDWDPDAADRQSIWLVASTAAVNITGILASATGRVIYLNNINSSGGFTITLKTGSTASTGNNRFVLPADVVLNPGDGVVLVRMPTRWRMFSPYGARTQTLTIAASDEITALTAGTAKVTFRMPYAMTLTGVRASLTTAQTSGAIFTVDINEGGVSLLSTKLTIDNTETTSTTAATAAVLSDVALADDAEITVDIDTVGDGTAKGLKVSLIGTPGQGVAAE